MHDSRQITYPPLNTLKRVAENVWIVDGPMIELGPLILKLPFSTRMTVLRLKSDDLFIHSPTPLPDSLRTEMAGIGSPRWIIGPNRLHYWWIPEWHAAYPEAVIYLAPHVKEQAAGRIDFEFRPLDCRDGYPWDAEVATLPLAGGYVTEIEFFHAASRTLILTDLIQNVELDKLPSGWLRPFFRLAGIAFPNGGMPADWRLVFRGRRRELQAAIETMIGWNPERVLFAHGKCFERDGAIELRRAFRRLGRNPAPRSTTSPS